MKALLPLALLCAFAALLALHPPMNGRERAAWAAQVSAYPDNRLRAMVDETTPDKAMMVKAELARRGASVE